MTTHRSLLAPDEMTGRGVYLARTLTPDGHHWYYSVDSGCHELDRVEVRGAVTPKGAQRILWAKLNEKDPQRQIALVRDTETEQPAKIPAHVLMASWGHLSPRRPA